MAESAPYEPNLAPRGASASTTAAGEKRAYHCTRWASCSWAALMAAALVDAIQEFVGLAARMLARGSGALLAVALVYCASASRRAQRR
ncbi:MAG: hypothetical protein ACLSVD_13575 [Eggerthellaceae bacterium]